MKLNKKVKVVIWVVLLGIISVVLSLSVAVSRYIYIENRTLSHLTKEVLENLPDSVKFKLVEGWILTPDLSGDENEKAVFSLMLFNESQRNGEYSDKINELLLAKLKSCSLAETLPILILYGLKQITPSDEVIAELYPISERLYGISKQFVDNGYNLNISELLAGTGFTSLHLYHDDILKFYMVVNSILMHYDFDNPKIKTVVKNWLDTAPGTDISYTETADEATNSFVIIQGEHRTSTYNFVPELTESIAYLK